jgi:hypothetical protein
MDGGNKNTDWMTYTEKIVFSQFSPLANIIQGKLKQKIRPFL